MRAFGVLVVVIGCSSGGGGGCKGKGESADMLFTDGNNYTYTGELDIAQIEIQSQTEATIDWSTMTTDIRGRPFDPTTIQQLAILGVNTPFDETIGLVERNELDESQDAYLFDNLGGTSAVLTDFSIIGAVLELELMEEDPEKTWLVSMLNVNGGQTDLLMSAVIVPTDASTNHDIALKDDSALLTVEVDLHSAPAIKTVADAGPYTLDWTEVTVDVFGAPFQPLLGDELIIGRYDTEDIGEIEAGFLQLDTNAVELYRVNVYGVTAVDLEDAESEDGTAFPGFTTDGTWLVGVICTTCITPVPLLLSIVDVG